MEWLRLYIDILDDEKVVKMSDTQYRIFTYLMLVAREKDQNGSFAYSPLDIAWRLRRPKNQIENTVNKLIDLEIITIENNVLHFINWSKRQYKSDDVNTRVKRYRQKNETLQLTLENRTEQIQNRKEEASAADAIPPPTKIKPQKTKYLDSVLLTDPEYKKLQEAMGQKNLDDAIKKLDYSITVKGGKYKDHYKTILNWKDRGFLNNGNGQPGHSAGGSGIPKEWVPESGIRPDNEEIERNREKIRKLTAQIAHPADTVTQ